MMDDKTYDENEKAMHWHGIDPISSPTPDHPAQYVNWNDAVRFCNWLSHTEGFAPAYEKTGKVWTLPPEGTTPGDFEEWQLVNRASGYRLPTGAEWEYLCRAGCDTQDPFGDPVNTRFLQAFASSRTRLVTLNAQEFNAEKCGTQPPNAWGLYDLHGNVVEWCQDWTEGFPGDLTPDVDAVTDPIGPMKQDPLLFKQIRDGIFYRTSTALTVGTTLRGFRVVRTVE
jgi:formylglycine-generating enzyme required for sulfatase activity